MLLVQEYLRSGKTLEDLKTERGVNYHETNGKVVLNYDQLETKESDPLSQQCRGLVLRKDTWEIVACPMFRFFNLEQKEVAARIDWNTAKYINKYDGSCIIIYFDKYQNKWCCGTRGRCEADADAHDAGMTFSQLVDIAIDQMCMKQPIFFFASPKLADFMSKTDKNKTYVFELTSPLNRIVCKYDDFKLTLLSVRDNITLKEELPEDHIDDFDIKPDLPEVFEFRNINHMIQVIREWNPEEREGVVVRDANFNRIKVKNPAYLAYSHIRQSLSTSIRGCIEVILLKKDDDIASMMPEVIMNRIKRLKVVIQKILEQTQKDYDNLKHIESMKEFAFEAQNCIWPAALFALKRNKTPDLNTFVLGNKPDMSKIPGTAVNSMFALCKKVDPSIQELELDLKRMYYSGLSS